jgi:hypothetical protein
LISRASCIGPARWKMPRYGLHDVETDQTPSRTRLADPGNRGLPVNNARLQNVRTDFVRLCRWADSGLLGGLRFTVAPAARRLGICRKLRPRPAKNTREKISHISYDKKNQASKPSQQAPDLPPEPGAHGAFARKHEYKRHDTVTLFAGIDLVTGPVRRRTLRPSPSFSGAPLACRVTVPRNGENGAWTTNKRPAANSLACLRTSVDELIASEQRAPARHHRN